MAEEIEQEVTTERLGPMVYGNGLEHILRICYDNNDVEGCMGILPYHSCQMVLGVCKRHLNIEGNDQEGFRFVAKDEEGERILERERELEEEYEDDGESD